MFFTAHFLAKRFSTRFAAKRFFTTVNPHVCFQSSFEGESFLTDGAFKGFCTNMNFHVHFEAALIVEQPVALGTFEVLLPAVFDHVVAELVCVVEFIPTLQAFALLLLIVNLHVIVQVVGIQKLFVAERTSERFLHVISHVRVQIRFATELLWTLWTRKRQYTTVSNQVSLQGVLRVGTCATNMAASQLRPLYEFFAVNCCDFTGGLFSFGL